MRRDSNSQYGVIASVFQRSNPFVVTRKLLRRHRAPPRKDKMRIAGAAINYAGDALALIAHDYGKLGYTQPVMSATPGLLERLHDQILSERDAQRRQLLSQWSLPLSERVARGFAIDGLHLHSLQPGETFALACQRNDSRFGKGDVLVLHRGDPQDTGVLQCRLEHDGGTLLEFSLLDAARPSKGDFASSLFPLQTNPDGWIADESQLDHTPFYLEALQACANTERGRQRVLPLLAGGLIPRVDYAAYQRAWKAAAATGLNEDQAEALAQCYATDLAHLVQGPPGTGKTRVLAHLARLLATDGQRVLVIALDHRVVNHALNKIAQVDPALAVCKIGPTRCGWNLFPPNYERFSASGFGDLPGGYVMGATPFATLSQRLAQTEFDVVVFEDASQVSLPQAIIGMLAGSRYIFIGDERLSLDGSIQPHSDNVSCSILGFLKRRSFTTLLDTTYRMNDVLAEWASRTFYTGAMQPAPGVAERRLKLRHPNPAWDLILDPDRPAVFVDLEHRNTTVRSRIEAEVICELVLALLSAGVPPGEIGVVVPFQAQGRTIRDLLRAHLPEQEVLQALAVDIVERLQGQEREVLLISLTTSNPAFTSQLVDFFFLPEELKLAVTRPRTKLIIVGSRYILRAVPVDAQMASWIDLLRDLLAYCSLRNLH
jgi:DNA replication ATP-dependent helicase Dna2